MNTKQQRSVQRLLRSRRLVAVIVAAFALLVVGLVYAYTQGLLFPTQAEAAQTEPAAPVSEPAAPEEPQPEPEPQPQPEPEPETAEEEQVLEKTGPVLALTFDDGPNTTITPVLIDELNKRGVHATFFMLGQLVQAHPEVAQLAVESGHQAASHGWDHQNAFTDLGSEQLADEINRSVKAIYDATGERPPYIRPPYGAINRATAAQIGYPLMLWNIDPRDWDNATAAEVKQHIVDNAFDGGVVILHDMYQTTLDGVLAAVDELLAQGWQIVSLGEYYDLFDVEPQPGLVYRGTALADI